MNKIYIFHTFYIKQHPLKFYDKFFQNNSNFLKNFWFLVNWDKFYFNRDNFYI
jgi:superoxide dismutase